MATECCNLSWVVNPGGAKSATELLKLTVILTVKLPIFVVRAPGSCSNLRAPLRKPLLFFLETGRMLLELFSLAPARMLQISWCAEGYCRLVILQNVECIGISWWDVLWQTARHSFSFTSVGLEQRLRICISNKFPYNANVASLKIELWESQNREKLRCKWGDIRQHADCCVLITQVTV